MFCRNCGNNINENKNFCAHCGNQLPDNNFIPKGVKGWSWGAFFLGPIWGIGNRLWFSFIGLIPYVNFIFNILLAIKGKEWAWKKNKSKDIKKFKKRQRIWDIVAMVIFVGSFIIGFVSAAALTFLEQAGDKDNYDFIEKSNIKSDLTAEIAQSVVNIACEDINTGEISGGSGTILTDDGIVITNSHIIPQDENYINVSENGCIVILPDPESGQPLHFYWANPIVLPGISDYYDIAYLEIYDVVVDEVTNEKLGYLPRKFPDFDDSLRCSEEYLKLGEEIRIFGYPEISGGYSLTITDGVVSSFSSDNDFIYTSAKISNGNSGGLAIDENGCMIGIPSMVSVDENESLGVIISMNLINKFSSEVEEYLKDL